MKPKPSRPIFILSSEYNRPSDSPGFPSFLPHERKKQSGGGGSGGCGGGEDRAYPTGRDRFTGWCPIGRDGFYWWRVFDAEPSRGGYPTGGMDSTGAEPSEWELAKKEALIFLGMDSKGGESSMRKEDEEGALLARMDPADGEPSMRKEDEEGALLARVVPAGGEPLLLKEDEEGALLARIVPAGGDPSMLWEVHTMSGLLSTKPSELWEKDLKEGGTNIVTVEEEDYFPKESLRTLTCIREMMGKLANEGTNTAMLVGSSKSAVQDEVMGKEISQQLFKDMPTKFDILDLYGTKLAIEEEHMPSGYKNVGSSKSVIDQAVVSPEMEESVTEAEEAVKEAEGTLLVGTDPTGGESPTWKQAEEEPAGKRSDMVRIQFPSSMPPKLREKKMKEHAAEQHVLEVQSQREEDRLRAARPGVSKSWSEWMKLKPMTAESVGGLELAKKERNMKNKTRQDEEARKTEASVTEVGSPEESVTESGKPQESVSEAGNRQKVMGKETLQKLLEDTRNKFDILDPNGDDEKDEIDMAKSAIAEEHMPSDWKNPSDRGEESVKLGSSKSAMDKQEVMGKETLHTAPAMLKYCLGMTPECWEKLMKHNNEREAEQEALLADSKKFCQSKSGNSVGAGKSFIPADPCATKSMGHYSVVQDDLDDHDRGNSTATPATKKKTAAEKEMEDEAKSFALHCKVWASKHGKRCGSFFETTVLSSMQFTHYTPGLIAFSSFCCTPVTLQILSIKLTRVDGGLEFPLSVYGVIAVRDLVDRNRNILFTRDIIHRQELKQNDPSLHLIGPSRAILFDERVWFEIELRVVAGSQNKALISCARSYSGGYGDGVYNICFKNRFCTLEVSSQPVKQTVQATILGVQVLHHNESWPLEYGGLLVACSPLSGEVVVTDGRLCRNIDPSSSPPIVLVDSKHEAVPKGRDGFVHLWRQVVSVELQGRLDFDIKSYSKSGGIAAEGCACFVPQLSNISQKKCLLGDAVVTITVAWSRVATSKMGIATESCAKRCF